jgi:prephenate dehydrogenase
VSVTAVTEPVEPVEPVGKANVVGAGLMGGSVGMALRSQGWTVWALDASASNVARGIERGAFDHAGTADDAVVTFVCTPVLSVPELAHRALLGGGIVTDIGSVKAPIVEQVNHPRFIGGHPMAGSELDGIEGSYADMFQGRTWVLTPTQDTDPDSYARLHAIVSSFGAIVVSVDPQHHDELVATVSHVPHLVAASLMSVAADGAEEHATLLRLAGGGFRDMTRIAAGHPTIWLDICETNSVAITRGLTRIIDDLERIRDTVASVDREQLRKMLQRARDARISLPVGAPPAEQLAEVRVPIPDRPGFIAEVSRLASELGVNIYDIEISHSAEGGGVLVAVVDRAVGDLLRGGLLARGFRPSVTPLGPA